MNVISYIIQHRVLLHVLYWLAVFIFFCLFGLGHNQPIKVSLYVIAVDFPVQIMASYSLLYFQIPLLFKKQYGKFTITTIVLGYVFYLLVHFNHDYGIGTYLISWHTQHEVWEIFAGKQVLFRTLVDIYIVVFITGVIKYVKSHLDSRQTIEELQAELSRKRYNTLKSRLNSQFILEILQVIIKKSEQNDVTTSETISLLSRALDDSLHHSQKEKRPLIDEAEEIGYYLALAGEIYQWFEMTSFTIGDLPRNVQIQSLIIRRIFEIIFQEFTDALESKQRFDIAILREGDYCIIQINTKDFNQDKITFSKLREFLSSQYLNKSYIIPHFSNNELNLVIKLQL